VSAHSPLPWRKRTGLEGERLIVSGERGLDVVCQYGHDNTADEIDYVEADGSLIEAAPNLLAACNAALDDDDDQPLQGETRRLLERAIAKAEGR